MKITNFVSLWQIIINDDHDVSKTMKGFDANLIKDEKKTFLVFRSGKIIATGFISLGQTRETIKERFPSAKFMRIVNISAVSFLPKKPNIIGFPNVSYEPELFPACIWRKGKKVAIYYSTGKLILTGCKSYNDLRALNSDFLKSIKSHQQESLKS